LPFFFHWGKKQDFEKRKNEMKKSVLSVNAMGLSDSKLMKQAHWLVLQTCGSWYLKHLQSNEQYLSFVSFPKYRSGKKKDCFDGRKITYFALRLLKKKHVWRNRHKKRLKTFFSDSKTERIAFGFIL